MISPTKTTKFLLFLFACFAAALSIGGRRFTEHMKVMYGFSLGWLPTVFWCIVTPIFTAVSLCALVSLCMKWKNVRFLLFRTLHRWTKVHYNNNSSNHVFEVVCIALINHGANYNGANLSWIFGFAPRCRCFSSSACWCTRSWPINVRVRCFPIASLIGQSNWGGVWLHRASFSSQSAWP